MLDDNELLFDELYEKTKDCGRVQFINLLMEKERENQELKEIIDKTITTLVNIDGDLSYGKKSDKICNLIDILRLVK